MIDLNIKRFCQVVVQINELNRELDKENVNYYAGGTSFEEINKSLINDIKDLETEFKVLLKEING